MRNINQREKVKLTLNAVKANIIAVFLLPVFTAIYAVPFFLMQPDKFSNTFFMEALPNINWFSLWKPYASISAILVLFIGIILHELIHGLTWLPFTEKGFKSLKFGFSIKAFAPYCHCKEPLKVKHYLAGAAAPAIILGIIPGLISIFTGNVPLLIFGIVFTISAMGDFMIIWLLRHENPENYVQDHPTEAGCYLFREEKA